MTTKHDNNTNEELKNTEETVQEKPVKKAPAVPKKTPASAKRKAAEAEHDPEETIEEAINKTGDWLFRNAKGLLVTLAVLVLAAAAYLGYKYVYMADRSEKANAMMFAAEQQFQIDSFAMALHGDGNVDGFLSVIEKYGSTPQANIAKHYAGVCYLKMGEMDNAAKYLAEYKATEGVPNSIINAQNFGLQADILVQKGEYDKSIELYKKAVDASDNVLTTPVYLKKLGLAYSKLGKSAEAVAAFERIKEGYAMSMEARDIDKYIGFEQQK